MKKERVQLNKKNKAGIDDKHFIINSKWQSIDSEYCALEIETTGFSPLIDKIVRIEIVKVRNGETIDKFECLLNPQIEIPQKIVNLTKITEDMVKEAETIDKVIPKVIDFLADSIIVVHYAEFNISFLKSNFEKYGYEFDYTYFDTLLFSKIMLPDLRLLTLKELAESFNIKIGDLSNINNYTKTLAQVFNKIIEISKKENIKNIDEIEESRFDERIFRKYDIKKNTTWNF